MTHGLRTPGEEIAFIARPEINSHSQIFRFLLSMPSLGVRSPCYDLPQLKHIFVRKICDIKWKMTMVQNDI